MANSLQFNLRVVLFHNQGAWIAQCLDYDIVAHGATLARAKEALAKAVAGQVIVALHHGAEPLADFSPAPDRFWKMFKEGERLAEPQPIFIPNDRIRAMASDLRIAA